MSKTIELYKTCPKCEGCWEDGGPDITEPFECPECDEGKVSDGEIRLVPCPGCGGTEVMIWAIDNWIQISCDKHVTCAWSTGLPEHQLPDAISYHDNGQIELDCKGLRRLFEKWNRRQAHE